MAEVEKDVHPVTTSGDEGYQVADQVTDQRRKGTLVATLVPWLLGACLIGFMGLVAIAAYEALTGAAPFARATPPPAFLAGTGVVLADRDDGPVTVWHVDGGCVVANALGQVPSGSDAQILDEACYDPEGRTYYHRIALANGSTGWVRAADIVPAAEYTPPPPTETLVPGPTDTPWVTDTPWPTPTVQPTSTPTPAPLPMGSSLSAGNWGVRVDRVEIVDSLSSPAGDKTVEAAGRFALVFLTATNHGRRLETLHASSVYIEDAEGNRYRNDDLASAYASSAGCLDFALDVNPSDTICLVAAIDISEQSSLYVLSLQGADETILLDVP